VHSQLKIAVVTALLCLPTQATDAEGGKPSCRETAGERQSARYVHECHVVSEATHPPCNAQLPCGLLISGIRHGCMNIHGYNAKIKNPKLDGPRQIEPTFCKSFLQNSN
jgi:hypothetical protein